jgi:hypothetical protein
MIGADHIAHTLIIRSTPERGTHPLPRVSDAIEQVLHDAPSQAQALLSLDHSADILFADSVLLVEGRTEDRLLPDVYAMIAGHSLSAHKVALVAPGGAGSIPKCLRILQVIGIESKALADLDFAFRCAPSAGLVPADDPDILQFKVRSAFLAPQHGFLLDGTGLPTTSTAMSSSQAFVLVAADPSAAHSVASLHHKLLAHGIWLLQKGDFGHYLGLNSTREESLLQYRSDLREKGCDAVMQHVTEIRDFIAWIRRP